MIEARSWMRPGLTQVWATTIIPVPTGARAAWAVACCSCDGLRLAKIARWSAAQKHAAQRWRADREEVPPPAAQAAAPRPPLPCGRTPRVLQQASSDELGDVQGARCHDVENEGRCTWQTAPAFMLDTWHSWWPRTYIYLPPSAYLLTPRAPRPPDIPKPKKNRAPIY